MFARTEEGIWQSSLLLEVPGIAHGFASRHARDWPGKYTGVRQIHSAIVVEAGADPPPQADAIVTSAPGQWLGIRTADCVPVLIADRDGKAVAAVHAGWRGTAAEIASRTVRDLVQRYGARPENLVAAVGPAIGLCCFEVGPDVADQFRWLPDSARQAGCVDLIEANRLQLQSAGLSPDSIDVSGLCTVCGTQEFHSYRRDKEQSGRMVAAISIEQT